MRYFLLRQAAVLPLAGMLIPMTVGLFAPGYSSIQQHMSELELLSPGISLACRVGAIISGLSIVGFAASLLLYQRWHMPFTALAAAVFGVSMISNGLFTMGSPLHGLYAIGLSVIVVPAFFAAESHKQKNISLIVSGIVLVYMWALMTGIDPKPIHGLTQRIATIPMFGWFNYVSLMLLREKTNDFYRDGDMNTTKS